MTKTKKNKTKNKNKSSKKPILVKSNKKKKTSKVKFDKVKSHKNIEKKAKKKTIKKTSSVKTPKKVLDVKLKKPPIKEIMLQPVVSQPIKAPGLFIGPKERKKITRRKPGTKTINYFDHNTQNAIVAYQKDQSYSGKNKIYLEKIYPAFDQLVENLINVYSFMVMYESRIDLKNECLEFLYGALPKFDVEKGSKAFSYFNVVAKNWLTIKSKQNSKRSQTYISIDNKEAIAPRDLDIIESYKIALDGEEIMAGLEFRDNISAIVKEIGGKVKTENEQSCVKAIKILIDNIEDIDLLNKRAILLYLREITGLSSKQLSIVLASLKKHYKELKRRDEI